MSDYPVDPKDESVIAAESLLQRLSLDSLDSDYLVERERPPGAMAKFLGGLVAASFGLVLSIAAAQADDDRPASELERNALVDRIDAQQEIAQSRRGVVGELRTEIEALESVPGTGRLPSALQVIAGAVPVAGPGIVITVESGDEDDGRVDDVDLRLLVNGLWQAGAEAVSINGQRLGPTSAIHFAGEAVVVNFRSLAEPYEVLAIGDDDLRDDWLANSAGRYLQGRSDVSGVTVTVRESSRVELPAVPAARLDLRHAETGRSTT